MKTIYLLLILILIPVLIWGQKSTSSAGSASNLLLRFATSARVSGLSEAYTGLANDENAILYNPGGLPNLNSSIISLNHAEWLEDIRIDNIIYGQKLTYNSAIGVSVTHMWMPTIQGKDQYGQASESFNVSSSIVQLGVGYKIHRALYLGVTAKYFQDQLANYNANGFAFDFGMYMQTAVKNLSVGLTIQNLGDKIKYDKVSQNLPMIIRGGLAYRLLDKQLLISTDLVKSSDTDLNLNLGLEYNFEESFFVRLGNQFSSTHTVYPSYGVGFIIKKHLETNYTFGNLEDLGMTHRVGFTLKFNMPNNESTYSSPKSVSTYVKKVSTYNGKIYLSSFDNEILISWEAISKAKYNIYVKSDEKTNWYKINSDPQKSAFKKIKKPTKSGKYSFKVTYILNNQENPIAEEVNYNVE